MFIRSIRTLLGLTLNLKFEDKKDNKTQSFGLTLRRKAAKVFIQFVFVVFQNLAHQTGTSAPQVECGCHIKNVFIVFIVF